MVERWGLMPPETNFGIASLEPLMDQVFWRRWTTVNMQRNYNPNIPEEPTFKKAFKRFVGEYFEKRWQKLLCLYQTSIIYKDVYLL